MSPARGSAPNRRICAPRGARQPSWTSTTAASSGTIATASRMSARPAGRDALTPREACAAGTGPGADRRARDGRADEHAAAASTPRVAPIFATPKTVAAMRNGTPRRRCGTAGPSSSGSRRARWRATAAARRARAPARARTGRAGAAPARRVDEVVPLDERAEHRAGIREQHADDSLRRAADLVVEAEEDAVVTREAGTTT